MNTIPFVIALFIGNVGTYIPTLMLLCRGQFIAPIPTPKLYQLYDPEKKRLEVDSLPTTNGRVATPILTRGPYLQMGTQTSAVIRWRTDLASVGKVTYGLSAGNLTSAVSETVATTDHELKLNGLMPDSHYFYSVGTTTQILQQGPDNYFLTAPPANTKRKIRVASFGDCGQNPNNNQTNVRDAFLSFRGNTPTDLWLLVGDNSYDGDDPAFQNNFFMPYQTNLMKNSMLFSIPGNHDYSNSSTLATNHNIPYFSIFSLPTQAEVGGIASGTEEWYSFDYGPIHFIMLDGYGRRSVNGSAVRLYADTINHPQITWLKRDLAATTKKWKIVYMHFPPYTQGSHNSETEADLIAIRQHINPILERFGVDMVVTGHTHMYERSYPLHDQYGPMSDFTANPAAYRFPDDTGTGRYDGSLNSCTYKNTSETKKQGTVYVVTGSSGAFAPSSLNQHPVMATDLRNKGGFFYYEVEDNRLDAKFIQPGDTQSYSIGDQFTIMKDVDKVQNLTITAGQSVSLSASFISDYRWSSAIDPSFTASSHTVLVTPTTSQAYVVKDSKNCVQDIYNVQLTCSANISGSLSVCSGQRTTLTASGGSSYLWNTGQTTASISATAGIYSVTVTNGGCSATASTTVSSCEAPDLSPLLYMWPSIQYGTTNFTVIVDVVELNSVPTNGLITVKLTKDSRINLSFLSNLTTLTGHTVQNEVWHFDVSDPNYYVLTTPQRINAGNKLSFGLMGVLNPGSTEGIIATSAIVQYSAGEGRLTNNIDTEKIEYFQR